MTGRRTLSLFVFALVVVAAIALAQWSAGGDARAQDDPDAPEPIQVGVIVQGPEGDTQTFCVALSPGATGLDALAATGLPIESQSGAMGTTVCRVGETGCTPPGESCFCQCEGGGGCAYWSYFHLDGDAWQYSAIGAAGVPLEQGAVEGWWWRDSAATDASPPPPLRFETICGPGAGFPRTVEDGLGSPLTLDAPPERIASVTLGSDEILLALVGPERLAGVSYLADDPAISNVADALADVPHTDLGGDVEQLISLEPDLVVMAAYNNPAVLDQLHAAGLPIFTLGDFNTLADIRANIRLLGQVTGAETRAESLIAEIDARLDAVQSAVARQAPMRVLYYEPGGITYGPGSTVDEIITLAGGVNVVAEAGLGPYPLVDAEFIIAADPDVILLGGWFTQSADPLAALLDDPAFADLRAVRAGRVVPVSDAHMTNVSQYFVEGVEDVAHALYPETFPLTESPPAAAPTEPVTAEAVAS